MGASQSDRGDDAGEEGTAMRLFYNRETNELTVVSVPASAQAQLRELESAPPPPPRQPAAGQGASRAQNAPVEDGNLDTPGMNEAMSRISHISGMRQMGQRPVGQENRDWAAFREQLDRQEREDSEEDRWDSDDPIFENVPQMRALHQILGARSRPRNASCRHERDLPLPAHTPLPRKCDLYGKVLRDTGRLDNHKKEDCNVYNHLTKRQHMTDRIGQTERVATTSDMLPQHENVADAFNSHVFNSVYSSDGNMFITTLQMQSQIHLYDTSRDTFRRFKTVDAREVGWSVLDVDFSPDNEWFVYSTWSTSVHICNIADEEKHYALNLRPTYNEYYSSFCVRFTSDGRKILAAGTDGYFYVYDRDRNYRTLMVDCHHDDANALAFADDSCQVVYTGGDDALVKVWDLRTVSEQRPYPVGYLAGHKHGVTFIDSRKDTRYLISNSKDQTIKLWDIRKFSNEDAIIASVKKSREQAWDYRWQHIPKQLRRELNVKIPGDSSVNTYYGHWVKHTLLRSRFSPMFTTGKRYIYTACAKGRVFIYDILTGEVVKRLSSRNCFNCIRDVYWHPFIPGELIAASWDGLLQMWTHRKKPYHYDRYDPSARNPFRPEDMERYANRLGGAGARGARGLF